MLDSGLRIRRFNPGAQRILNLGTADIGHSIRDLKLALPIEHLDEKIPSVLERLPVCELDVHDSAGRSYPLRIRPYKTMDNTLARTMPGLTHIGRERTEGV